MTKILAPGTKVGPFTIVEHVRDYMYTVRCKCGRLTRNSPRHMEKQSGCASCVRANKRFTRNIDIPK